MRKLLLPVLVLGPLALFGQYESSSFTQTGRGVSTVFATDYQTCGINPANLGWDWKFDKKKVALGFNEMAYSIYSEALTKTELRKNLLDMVKSNEQEFTRQEKIDAAKKFADEGLTLNIDYGAMGFAFMGKKFGGIGLRVNDRFQFYSRLGQQASDLLFLGKTSQYFDTLQIINSFGDTTNIQNNQAALDTLQTSEIIKGISSFPKLISQLLKGSEMTFTWTREWNVSYGRRIFGDSTFALFAGVGFKYYQGIGMLNIKSDGQTLEAFSAMSPFFNIPYDAEVQNGSNVVTGRGFPPKTVGQGYGFDFGVNVVIKNKIKLGASLIGVGSIKWKGNVYTVKDTMLTATSSIGLNSYNIFNQFGTIVGDKGFLDLKGEQERVTKLPSVLRLGGSIKLGKKVEIGADAIMPLNEASGNYEKGIFGLGGDIMPVKWLRLSAGFLTGGNYDFQIPMGIVFITRNGTYECGVASRDAITFFTQNGPTLSLSTGFMRFRF